MNYKYLTRKQANIVYAAFKKGRIALTKAQTRELYDTVEDRCLFEDHALTQRVYKWSDVCGYLCKGEDDFAQARIDGLNVVEVCIRMDKKVHTEKDWFHEAGEEYWERVYAPMIMNDEELMRYRNAMYSVHR